MWARFALDKRFTMVSCRSPLSLESSWSSGEYEATHTITTQFAEEWVQEARENLTGEVDRFGETGEVTQKKWELTWDKQQY